MLIVKRACAAATAAAASSHGRRPARSEPGGTEGKPGTRRVRLVQVLHRHGARTPTDPWPPQLSGMPEKGTPEWDRLWGRCPTLPKSTFKGGSFMPVLETSELCGRGSLTFTGFEQVKSLGSYLAAEYALADGISFLYPDELVVLSTAVDRAILSAGALLQGIYPGISLDDALAVVRRPYEEKPKQETKWATQRPCQWSCPRLKQLVDLSKDSFAKSFGSWQKAKDALNHEDQCRCLWAAGASHRNCRQDVSFANGSKSKAYLVIGGVEEQSEEGARLSGSRLVAEMHNFIEQALASPEAVASPEMDTASRHPPLVIHSGHDVSIISFLRALGLPLNTIPTFAASVIVELIQSTDEMHSTGEGDEWIVRVVYFDGAPSAANCGKEMLSLPLSTWQSKVAPLLDTAKNWTTRCRAVDL